jgi:serine/threonine-protein kinase
VRTCPLCHRAYPDEVSFCPNDGTRTLATHVDAVSPTVTPGIRSPPPVPTAPPPPFARPLAGPTPVLTGAAVDAHAAPSPSLGTLAPGRVLGVYRLQQLLGEGGMGQVFLAEHVQLGRKVALKLLRREFAQDPQAVKRFFAEAQAVNRIQHENIVEITDFVAGEGEHKYYIMELLRGQSLADLVAREGLLPLSRIADVMGQVCAALAAVHAAKIVHRDLKPANIFLVERAGRRDFVKLLDFGIAKLTAPVDGQSLVKTTTGVVVGTPAYMSPEQASARPIDHRTDVYAVGVMLYELVLGKRPFDAPSFGEMMVQIMTRTPQRPSQMKDPPRHVPKELEDLIFSCLEKDARHRPDDMRIVEARLRAAVRGPQAAQPGVPSAVPAPGVRELRIPKRALHGAGIALAVLLLVPVVARLRRTPAGEDALPGARVAGSAPSRAPLDTVKIEFLSVPSGAEVTRGDNYRAIGHTPLVADLPRSSAVVRFTFRLSGYKDAEREVQLDKDSSVVVSLDSYSDRTQSYEELEAKEAPDTKKRKSRGSYSPRAIGVGPD